MQLRSGRCLVYLPPAQQAGRNLCQPQHSSEDRFSSLPEDLLLEILTRLKSADEAARAGAVSRDWRDLWTKLPELTFYYVHPLSVESVLARITRPSLDLLDISFYLDCAEVDCRRQVSLILHGAARVLPEKLIISVSTPPIAEYTVELPCFQHTSYLSLDLMNSLPIVLPQSGEFTALKNLYLQSCCVDIGALLPLCPCLRILDIKRLMHVDTVIVHSLLLEEFVLEGHAFLHRIDITAPVLKEVTLEVDIVKSFSLFFSAPMVKKLRWDYYFCCYGLPVFNQIWKLKEIKERKLDEFYVISMIIRSCDNYGPLDAEWNFEQVLAHLPVPEFSVLKLDLGTTGHAFGPLMLRLLQVRPTIQRLNVVLVKSKVRVPCLVNCPCEQPGNWRSEDISLANLEIVEIHGLQVEDDEVDLIKLMLRCAPVLRRLTVSISDDVSPSDIGYEKIYSTMKEYPDVECHIVASGSEGVVIHE